MSLHDQRRKWKNPKQNLKVGDTVLVRDKNMHRYLWGTARVIRVKNSLDGLVRSVLIQPIPMKGEGTSKAAPRERPVHDLVLLESAESQNLDLTVETQDSTLAPLHSPKRGCEETASFA